MLLPASAPTQARKVTISGCQKQGDMEKLFSPHNFSKEAFELLNQQKLQRALSVVLEGFLLV